MQNTHIIISRKQKELYLITPDSARIVYPVAVGKPETPTPEGHWHIINKKILSDAGVFGLYWLGLNNPGYGIHGTNHPELIGQAVSNGCIRMHSKDIQTIFQKVTIGTSVIITE